MPAPMTPDDHAAKAQELAATAENIYLMVGKIARKNDGAVPAALHAGMLSEMTAVASLAQTHATLATRPHPAPERSDRAERIATKRVADVIRAIAKLMQGTDQDSPAYEGIRRAHEVAVEAAGRAAHPDPVKEA